MTFTDDNGRLVVLTESSELAGSRGAFGQRSVGRRSEDPLHAFIRTVIEAQAMVGSPLESYQRPRARFYLLAQAILFNQAKVCAGFLMHRVDFSTNVPVLQLYNPQDRQQVAPGFNWVICSGAREYRQRRGSHSRMWLRRRRSQ